MRIASNLRNSFAPWRGRNPQNREERVSESKNPHFPPPQKRAFRVKKPPPFPHRALQGEWGFLTRNALFWGGGKCRVAQEPNRNRKPEPSEPFFPKPNFKAEPKPPEPFSRNRNRNRNPNRTGATLEMGVFGLLIEIGKLTLFSRF